ncbi:MAG: 3-dehydroquinate synthase family protein, partial [Terriglobia bacterium]
ASYMRGVDYVQVPTTLVGQIDSAIGGKTGVNLRGGKNLLGAFHHPRAVVADPRALTTLPAREYRAGLYEGVKGAVIGDAKLFSFLEDNMDAVLARQPAALRTVLRRSIALKARIVGADERERGLRRILNFGHTVGHALETLSGYQGLRHGEAVGWGMLAATCLAVQQGLLAAAAGERIRALVLAVGKLPPGPRVSAERVYEQLFADKKKDAGALRFVLPRGIGRVVVVSDVPRARVLRCLRALSGSRTKR